MPEFIGISKSGVTNTSLYLSFWEWSLDTAFEGRE
jgi:hypothetical protein